MPQNQEPIVISDDRPGRPIVIRVTDNRKRDIRWDCTIVRRWNNDDGKHVGYTYVGPKGGHISSLLNEVVPDSFEGLITRILSGYYTDHTRLRCPISRTKSRGIVLFKFDVLNCYYRKPKSKAAKNEALLTRLLKKYKNDFEEALGEFVKECV